MIRSEKKQFEMTQLSAKQRAAKLELVDNLTERYVTCFVCDVTWSFTSRHRSPVTWAGLFCESPLIDFCEQELT